MVGSDNGGGSRPPKCIVWETLFDPTIHDALADATVWNMPPRPLTRRELETRTL